MPAITVTQNEELVASFGRALEVNHYHAAAELEALEALFGTANAVRFAERIVAGESLSVDGFRNELAAELEAAAEERDIYGDPREANENRQRARKLRALAGLSSLERGGRSGAQRAERKTVEAAAAGLDRDRREKLAELAILDRFDTLRRRAGHDYGVGQRHSELVNRRRELIGYGIRDDLDELTVELTPAERLAAYERIAPARIARLEREDYRSRTSATTRTMETWKRLRRELDEPTTRISEARSLVESARDKLTAEGYRDRMNALELADERAGYQDADELIRWATAGLEDERRDA